MKTFGEVVQKLADLGEVDLAKAADYHMSQQETETETVTARLAAVNSQLITTRAQVATAERKLDEAGGGETENLLRQTVEKMQGQLTDAKVLIKNHVATLAELQDKRVGEELTDLKAELNAVKGERDTAKKDLKDNRRAMMEPDNLRDEAVSLKSMLKELRDGRKADAEAFTKVKRDLDLETAKANKLQDQLQRTEQERNALFMVHKMLVT